MRDLETSIEEYVSFAGVHAANSYQIIEKHGLEPALEYCKQQGIDPPQCSLTAVSKNADMLRDKAVRMLCDDKWWARRLKKQAMQGHEMYHRMQRPIIVSDELIEYLKKQKR